VKFRYIISQSLATILIIFIIATLTGCSVTRPVGSYIGQQYINTVSYFNTFYNARRLFDEAVAEVEAVRSRQSTQVQGGQAEMSNQTREKFNNVIEKCSRLLHQYPRSKYADNSVLLIGKSYYYLNQNVQAERKFLELLAEFPGSPFVAESLLLLSKTQRRMNKNAEAQVTISDMIGRLEASRRRDLLAEAFIEKGNLEKDIGQHNNALSSFEEAASTARNSDIKSLSLFNVAMTLELLGRKEDAFSMYSEVIAERPPAQLLFDAYIARVHIMSEGGNFEDAIETLHEMLDNYNLSEYTSLVEYEAADVYRAHGYLEQAIDQFVYVDTSYVRTEVSTRASFSLGSIYESKYGNYASAKQYYEKASRGSPPSEVTRNASQKNEIFTRYWRFRNEINRLDSLISVQKSTLADVRAMQAADSVVTDTLGTTGNGQPAGKPQPAITDIDALLTIIRAYEEQKIKSIYELAGLFYIELARPDSSLYWYQTLVRDYPASEFTPQSLYALGELLRITGEEAGPDVQIQVSGDSLGSRESVYAILIDRYPDTEYALQAKRIMGIPVEESAQDTSIHYYRIAEEEMLDGDPHRSVDYFRVVVRDYSTSEYAPRAQYAIGWIYENILDLPDSAAINYQHLLTAYPSSQFAASVKPKVDAWITENQEPESESETETQEDDMDPAPEVAEDEVDLPDDQPRRGGIPLVRPTDIRNLEELPDTARVRRNIIE
jgi:TolA-binding protein